MTAIIVYTFQHCWWTCSHHTAASPPTDTRSCGSLGDLRSRLSVVSAVLQLAPNILLAVFPVGVGASPCFNRSVTAVGVDRSQLVAVLVVAPVLIPHLDSRDASAGWVLCEI